MLKKYSIVVSLIVLIIIISYCIWSSESFHKCIDDHTKYYSEQNQKEVSPPLIVRGFYFTSCVGGWIDNNHEVINAVSTIFIALFTLTLWIATDSLVKMAKRQDSGTKRIERAYVYVQVVCDGQFGVKKHISDIMGQEKFSIRVNFINSGKTPATIKKIRADYDIRDAGDKPPDELVETELSKRVIPDGMFIAAGSSHVEPVKIDNLSTSDIGNIKNMSKILYVVGIIEYETVFDSPQHHTSFCWQFTQGDKFLISQSRLNQTT